jgi:hypothetical protein
MPYFRFQGELRGDGRSGSPRNGFMRAFICKDGRVLGFDAVEWLTWFAAVNLAAFIAFVI